MLSSFLRWELIITIRQGIWIAALFVMIFWSATLSFVPTASRELATAALLFVEIAVFGLFLLPAGYYLDKGQRILDGLIATPMPISHWLLSKTVVFTLQSIVIAIVIALVSLGWETIHWGWFALAVLLLTVPQLLVAFAVATRYHGISEFLFPAIPVLFVLQLPLLAYVEVLTGPLWWLFPTYPGLALLDLALSGSGADQPWLAAIWGLTYSTVPAWIWARHRLQITATRQAGSR